MKAQIIQIGNSQGVRIPKVILEESKLAGEVELEVHKDGILIRSTQKPRDDRDVMFKALADSKDDHVLESNPATIFEKKEWQW